MINSVSGLIALIAFIMQGTLYSGQTTRSLAFLFAESFIIFMWFLCGIMMIVITTDFLKKDEKLALFHTMLANRSQVVQAQCIAHD